MGKGLELAVVYRDQEIALRAKDFLRRQHFPSLHQLEIDVCDGEMTVCGNVESYYEKQIALSACQRVPGVAVIVDRILVDGR